MVQCMFKIHLDPDVANVNYLLTNVTWKIRYGSLTGNGINSITTADSVEIPTANLRFSTTTNSTAILHL